MTPRILDLHRSPSRGSDTVRDPSQSAANLYHTDMWPETYVIDRQGMIRRKLVGPQEWTSPEIVGYLNSL